MTDAVCLFRVFFQGIKTRVPGTPLYGVKGSFNKIKGFVALKRPILITISAYYNYSRQHSVIFFNLNVRSYILENVMNFRIHVSATNLL